MAIEVFNRYEKKYRIKQDVYVELRKRLEQYMEADKFYDGIAQIKKDYQELSEYIELERKSTN